MLRMNNIVALFLTLAIIMAGIPALAQQPCPMEAKMHLQQMDMKGMQKDIPCKDSAKMAKQMSQKDKCCDDPICNAKCSALNGGVTSFYMPDIAPLSTFKATERFTLVDSSLSSGALFSQDRPPKYLS